MRYMAIPESLRPSKEVSDQQQKIHELLAEKHACYVLITCDPPTESGEMQVKMTYEGDPLLAAYLVQGAQTYIADYAEEGFFYPETRY
jgi:hypothetical protein